MRSKYINLVLNQLKKGNYFWFPKNINKFMLTIASAYFKKALTGPISAAITVTWRCNAKCVMCDYPKRADKQKELSTNEIKKIINDLKILKTTGLTFYGGEPLLREDIFELINYAAQKGLITHIPTNGILLSNKNITQKLIDSNIDTIAVSLDSSTKEGYKKIRKIDGFDKTIKGIKNLIELRKKIKYPPDITIISTITKDNIDDIPEIIKLAKDLKVDGISIFPAQPMETLQNKFDKVYKTKFRNMVLYLIKEKKKGNKIIDDSLNYLNYTLNKLDNKTKRIKCFAPYTDLHIDCFGNIYPCVSFLGLNKPFTNIRNKSLKEVWFSKEMQKYRNTLEKCKSCEYMCHIEFSLPFNKFWLIKK